MKAKKLSKVSDRLIQWGVVIVVIIAIIDMFTTNPELMRTFYLSALAVVITGVIFHYIASNKKLRDIQTIQCIINSEKLNTPNNTITLEFPIGETPKTHEILRINDPNKPEDLKKEIILRITRVERIYQFGRLQALIVNTI